MRYGYIRVSSRDQNTARQLDGVAVDKLFIDKLSGKSTDRPALQEMLRTVAKGVIEQALERRALERATGIAAIFVVRLEHLPALVALAVDRLPLPLTDVARRARLEVC